jgi:hypothetical protein
MNWMAVGHFLKKCWVWLKNHWHVPALAVYTVFMYALMRRNGAESAIAVLGATRDSHKKQVAAMNATHKAEIEKRDAIIGRYNEVMENLEKNYKEELSDLDKHKKARVKDLVKKYHEKPEELTKMLGMSFGINYAE